MDTELLKRNLNVLHLEDNENDHLLVAEILKADGLKCEFTVAKSENEFTEALEKSRFDLIISDHTLPSYDGLRALSAAQRTHAEIPFVFFSGTIGEDVAVDSLKHGAVDYVLKQRPNRLIAAVRRALRNATERRRLQNAERPSAKARSAWASSPRPPTTSFGNGTCTVTRSGSVKISRPPSAMRIPSPASLPRMVRFHPSR